MYFYYIHLELNISILKCDLIVLISLTATRGRQRITSGLWQTGLDFFWHMQLKIGPDNVRSVLRQQIWTHMAWVQIDRKHLPTYIEIYNYHYSHISYLWKCLKVWVSEWAWDSRLIYHTSTRRKMFVCFILEMFISLIQRDINWETV